jgi:hypothetical protein
MTTKLDKSLKREIQIKGKPFVVTIDPEVLKLVGKGRRKGLEIRWDELISGEAALAAALQASISPRVNLEPSARDSLPQGLRPGRRATARKRT